MDETTPNDRTPERDAAELALAIVSQAAAITQGDDEALDASDDNLREVVAEQADDPLTEKQEAVVSTLGAAGGSLAAGLSAALAEARGIDADAVLAATARSILAHADDVPLVDGVPRAEDGQDGPPDDRRRP
jgi:hypothetical protein